MISHYHLQLYESLILNKEKKIIKKIILNEDVANEYLEKRAKLNTKEEKQELAEEYYPKIIKEYIDVSS